MFILYTQMSESKEVEILKIGTKEECVKAAQDRFNYSRYCGRLSIEEIEEELDRDTLSDFNSEEYEQYKLREV